MLTKKIVSSMKDECALCLQKFKVNIQIQIDQSRKGESTGFIKMKTGSILVQQFWCFIFLTVSFSNSQVVIIMDIFPILNANTVIKKINFTCTRRCIFYTIPLRAASTTFFDFYRPLKSELKLRLHKAMMSFRKDQCYAFLVIISLQHYMLVTLNSELNFHFWQMPSKHIGEVQQTFCPEQRNIVYRY